MKRKLPTYHIAEILKRRDQILDIFSARELLDTAPDLDEFYDLVEAIGEKLPDSIPGDTLVESCEFLMGEVITEGAADDLAWRLAGNVRRLSHGHPVLPWSGIANPEWMPVQVLRVDVAFTKYGKPGGEFTMQFLGGQACPESVVKFWPLSYCHMLAPRIGFTKYARSKYPFTDVSELTNLRMMVLVEAGEPEITFKDVAATSGTVTWNKRYIRMRARTLPGFKCPRKWPEEKPCYRCFWGEDACPAAVRPDTLVKQVCPQCNFTKYFDPTQMECCIGCHQKNLRNETK